MTILWCFDTAAAVNQDVVVQVGWGVIKLVVGCWACGWVVVGMLWVSCWGYCFGVVRFSWEVVVGW